MRGHFCCGVGTISILDSCCYLHDTPQFLVTDHEDLMGSSKQNVHEDSKNPLSIYYVRVQELLDLRFVFIPGQNTNTVTTQPSLQR